MTDLGNLSDLIDEAADRGLGVTIMPFREGDPEGGWLTEDTRDYDGWEIGYITTGGGGDLACAPTLPEAIDLALAGWRDPAAA